MPKLKGVFRFVGSKKNAEKEEEKVASACLETDAAPVYDDNSQASGRDNLNNNTTPTTSAEMTEQMVQQLSDVNYNSLEAAAAPPTLMAEQNNTINNAQQQLIMNFNNANNLHFGSVYNINGAKGNATTKTAQLTQQQQQAGRRLTSLKTTTVVAMMQSKEEPSHRILDTISMHLGEGWKTVMRDLGHSEGQIEQAIIDHQMHGNIKEVIYQLLLQWVQAAEDDEATLGRITSLLWERKHHEVVQRMKIAWKETQKSNNSNM